LIHRNDDDDDDAELDVLAFCWVDTNHRYFVSTASSLASSVPISLKASTSQRRTNADAGRVQLLIDQPKVSALDYSAVAKIEQHK
jgi:hypothetical protein